MEPTLEAGAPEAEVRAPNVLVRLGQVFFAPGDLFETLRARPVWIDMMLVLLVMGVASQLLVPEETFRELFLAQLPPETDPAAAEQMIGVVRTWGLAIAVVWLPLAATVVAGLILLAYNVMLGGEAGFKQLFSAVTHAYAILSVGGLVVLGLILMGGEQVVLSPALLFPDLGDGFFVRLFERINVFAVWTCIVLGIAVSKFYPKRSAFGGTMYLFVLYLLLVSLSAFPAG